MSAVLWTGLESQYVSKTATYWNAVTEMLLFLNHIQYHLKCPFTSNFANLSSTFTIESGTQFHFDFTVEYCSFLELSSAPIAVKTNSPVRLLLVWSSAEDRPGRADVGLDVGAGRCPHILTTSVLTSARPRGGLESLFYSTHANSPPEPPAA